MRNYILKRLLFTIPTLLGVFIVVYIVIRQIPGDPAEVMLGKTATTAQIEIYRTAHGLDRPAIVQFWLALKHLFVGDLGMSLSHYRPVLEVVFERLPSTIELALYGIVISSFVSIVLGVVAATFRGKWPDLIIIAFSTLGTSLPTFYIGLWVLVIFALKLGIIPVLSNMVKGTAYWKTLFGPVLTMVLGGSLVRTTRSSMLEIMDEDFIRTAKAKGVSGRKILFKHALGNALIPIVTMVGYGLAISFGGAIVLETVFVRSGVGKLLIDAIGSRDYPLVQGATFIIATFMILANLLTDVVTGIVDPRIRVAGDVSF
ncbi:MAG: ABC transporter permease [Oscillospiraceae bacterium]|nr:ABC transporter permease [Oscillospiraceae bacterium]MCL2126198.1 ABC transporter permease [Oscillospiraceae bacterium]